ncbi:MAG: hypothetical protein M3R04_04795 [bacterium]|nr:hypothetical protein [bacterium]
MPFSLLLQTAGQPDRTMLIVIGVVALFTLVVLGLKFLRNLFEVITAPTASLKYHGQSDHFFQSLLIVFLGGLIATTILVATQERTVTAFSHYSGHVSQDMANANSNELYRGVVEDFARTKIDSNFNIFFIQNMIMLPMLFVAVWLFFGLLCFVFSKMFGAGVTAADMLGSLAYSAFFTTIGIALAAPLIIDFIAGQAGAPPASPDPMSMVGAVLVLYGVVLFMMGVSAAAEITIVQVVGIIVMLLIVLGIAGYFVFTESQKSFTTFKGKVTGYNPATGVMDLK